MSDEAPGRRDHGPWAAGVVFICPPLLMVFRSLRSPWSCLSCGPGVYFTREKTILPHVATRHATPAYAISDPPDRGGVVVRHIAASSNLHHPPKSSSLLSKKRAEKERRGRVVRSSTLLREIAFGRMAAHTSPVLSACCRCIIGACVGED